MKSNWSVSQSPTVSVGEGNWGVSFLTQLQECTIKISSLNVDISFSKVTTDWALYVFSFKFTIRYLLVFPGPKQTVLRACRTEGLWEHWVWVASLLDLSCPGWDLQRQQRAGGWIQWSPWGTHSKEPQWHQGYARALLCTSWQGNPGPCFIKLDFNNKLQATVISYWSHGIWLAESKFVIGI